MPVLCVRGNGTVSTHILTVLTVDGVRRLLSASRSPLAPQVLQWLTKQVEDLCGHNPPDPPPSTTNAVAAGGRSRPPIDVEHSAAPWTNSSGAPPLLPDSSPSSSSSNTSSSSSSMRSTNSNAGVVSPLEAEDPLQSLQRPVKTESSTEAEGRSTVELPAPG